MKRRYPSLLGVLWFLVAGLFLPGPAGLTAAAPDVNSPEAREARLAWFKEAKYGLFIHWGLYAIPAGIWKGERSPGIGEWIMHRMKIPVPEYERARRGLQSVAVRRRCLGETGGGRRHEVHRHHRQTPRRLRDVPVVDQPLQHP
jgi:hypothetical protein